MRYIGLRSPGFSWIRLAPYYIQRAITFPALRTAVVTLLQLFVQLRTFRGKQYCRMPHSVDILGELRKNGIASLGEIFSEGQCRDIRQYLWSKELTNKNFPGLRFTLDQRPAGARLGDYSLRDLINCPHILSTANHPRLLALARAYLGCTPTISGLSARWSFPHDTNSEVVQRFHRDYEDWKSFRVMVYLSDVEVDSGPHVYIVGTHVDKRTARLNIYSDAQVLTKFNRERILRMTGRRGFSFVVDTAGLHRGEVPKAGPRLLLSFQYSILPCYLYEYEAADHDISSGLDPYINRLVARFQGVVSR